MAVPFYVHRTCVRTSNLIFFNYFRSNSNSASHLVSRSQTVTLAVTVWTTAVKRFVRSSPGSRVGDKWLLSATGTAKGMNLIT